MKKSILLFWIILLIGVNSFSQAPPEAFNYSSVIRGSNGQAIPNSEVALRFSILSGSFSGSVEYQETHLDTTDQYGVININIGTGVVQQGDFSTIEWGSYTHYLKIELDDNGGSNFLEMGTIQLLSVPYALHAKTALSVINSGSNNFYLGQDTLGGIVFYVYLGSDGNQHGLIVSKIETSAEWQSTPSTTGATSMWDGSNNTNLMTTSPVKDWITSNFSTDWYLPSINELSILYHNQYLVNRTISVGGWTPFPFGQTANTDYYWSSTEVDNINAYHFGFPQELNYILGESKTSLRKVRAIRQF